VHLHPENITYQAQRANELMQNGQHDEAIKLFNNILKKNPHNYSSITSRGHAEKTIGKTDQAILSYKEAY
jgi:Tfp pilus assembly protein PilF